MQGCSCLCSCRGWNTCTSCTVVFFVCNESREVGKTDITVLTIGWSRQLSLTCKCLRNTPSVWWAGFVCWYRQWCRGWNHKKWEHAGSGDWEGMWRDFCLPFWQDRKNCWQTLMGWVLRRLWFLHTWQWRCLWGWWRQRWAFIFFF